MLQYQRCILTVQLCSVLKGMQHYSRGLSVKSSSQMFLMCHVGLSLHQSTAQIKRILHYMSLKAKTTDTESFLNTLRWLGEWFGGYLYHVDQKHNPSSCSSTTSCMIDLKSVLSLFVCLLTYFNIVPSYITVPVGWIKREPLTVCIFLLLWIENFIMVYLDAVYWLQKMLHDCVSQCRLGLLWGATESSSMCAAAGNFRG